MSLEVSEQELIQRAIQSRLEDVYTAMPGRVETFYGRTADIAPAISRPIKTTAGEIRPEDLPIIPNALLCYPSGGGFSVTWPLVKGDHVIILVMTYALTQWRKTGETSPPGDLRLHHFANSVGIPLLQNPTAPEESSVEMDPPPTLLIRAPEDGRVVIGAISGSGYAALAQKTDDNFTLFKNAISGAAVTPNDGGAAFKANVLAALGSIPSVACVQVKIK